MIWDKTDRFKHPEDGKFVATEYNVNPSLEPIIGGPKMVDDWKKSSVSVADSIRSRQNQSGFLPASVKGIFYWPMKSVLMYGCRLNLLSVLIHAFVECYTGQENQHIRGRETIFSIAAERDESPVNNMHARASFVCIPRLYK